MLAIVEISGKQYKVEPGYKIKVPAQKQDIGEKISYDKVLLLSDGEDIIVGTPTVKDAIVEVTVLEHNRDKKVIVFKKKRRKRYRTKNSHRQKYSLIQIDSILKKPVKKSTSTEKKTTTSKEATAKED